MSDRIGHPGFFAILDELAALHEKKGQDYGTDEDCLANVRAAADFGVPPWKAVAVRMGDKMKRIQAFCRKGSLANESLEDSLLDICSYAIIALVLFREEQGK